jgi:chromosome segregation ATPase
MNDMLVVTILAVLFVLIIWIMNILCRSTEKQTRHSSANLNKRNKIKPDVACNNQHALPRPVINDEFSTPSGEDLNNQSFLQLKAKVDENNLILLEKERLANELSLVQSQLTDSHSKLQMFQNVQEELASTKSELEEKKIVVTDLTEKNLRLTNNDSRLRQKIEDDTRELESKTRIIAELEAKNLSLTENDSQLRRKIEDRDKIIASSAIEKNLIVLDKERLENELSLVQSQLTDSSSKLQMFQNVHDELETTKCELEEKKREMTEIIGENLQLKNENSGLWRKIEDKDRIIIEERDRIMASSAIEKNLELEKERLANELSLVQSQLADSSSKLQMFQNVHDELAATKSELENNKREMTDIKEINLRLTNDDSRLRRTIEDMDRIIIEDRDRIMASNAIEKNLIVLENQRIANELSLVQSQLTDSHSKVKQFRNESATIKSELEEKKSLITDMTDENSRLGRKIEDKDRTIRLIVFDKESLANELSLLQSQLTFSPNRQMFQNLRDKLAATKSELENNKRLMTDITEKNIRLKKDDSRLRRKIEERDKIIASSAIEKNQILLEKERLANELSLVQSQLRDSHSNLHQIVQKVHDELAATKSENENNKRVMTDMELESKNRTISELETEILRWTENDSQLRLQLEETDRLLQSSQAEMEELRVSQTERVLEHLQDQVKSLEEKKKKWKKPFENFSKWKIFKSKEMKPKLAAEVG